MVRIVTEPRKSRVFPRHTAANLPTAVAGDGAYLIDSDGKRYLDASGGAAVSCLGHHAPAVVRAVQRQLDELPYAHTSFFTSLAAESLADLLVGYSHGAFSRVYFLSGGSEAVETALKLARQYHLETGQPARSQFIARRQSYHGNTLGALAAGGSQARRAPFQPMLAPAFHHIDPCHYWRWGETGESAADYGRRMADQLETKILALGPENVAAFLAETVVGATMGAVAATEGYFQRIRQICDKYGVLLILDEVMSGAGRTGTFFAWEQEGIAPDIVCLAKGLGAGIQPIAATLTSARIYGAIEGGSGFFQHGHTYIGHAAACAAGVAVINEIEANNLLEAVRERGVSLQQALGLKFGQHPHVGDIRGRGLFVGLELVADRSTGDPFDPDRQLAGRLKKAAMANGLMIYPSSGTVDGIRGDHILLAPPYIYQDHHIEELVDKLATTLSDCLDHA